MKYFTYIAFSYVSKNNLHKAIYLLLKNNERTIVDADNIEAFKKEILDRISELNKQFPNCNAVEVHWWSPGKSDRDFFLSGNPTCNFHLYASK